MLSVRENITGQKETQEDVNKNYSANEKKQMMKERKNNMLLKGQKQKPWAEKHRPMKLSDIVHFHGIRKFLKEKLHVTGADGKVTAVKNHKPPINFR